MITDFPLQTRGLTKFYSSTLAVDHLSLDVARGEVFGFLGPNGAGKTTSINMMVGLLEPTAGDVLIEGQSIRAGGASVRNQIGVCPQENTLWEKLTCLEQLEFIGINYGLSQHQARTHGSELLESLGLAARENELAGRLSGGLKRRLNLALALVHDPQIVFLDEPEAGLDPQSRVLVRNMIRTLAHRKTVVLTTHNMDEAERLADRIAIIDRGRLLVIDTPDALKRRLGEGSVLEIELDLSPEKDNQPAIQSVLECLRSQFPDALVTDGLLTLRGQDLSIRLPDILQQIQTSGCRTGSIHMRPVSLEDVFLSLTGRGLRE